MISFCIALLAIQKYKFADYSADLKWVITIRLTQWQYQCICAAHMQQMVTFNPNPDWAAAGKEGGREKCTRPWGPELEPGTYCVLGEDQ